MREEFRAADFLGFRLEHIDEQFADDLAFRFRVLDAVEFLQEQIGRVDINQRNIVMPAEQLLHRLAFIEPQQPVIDEHAGELRADRFVQEHGGDG